MSNFDQAFRSVARQGRQGQCPLCGTNWYFIKNSNVGESDLDGFHSLESLLKTFDFVICKGCGKKFTREDHASLALVDSSGYADYALPKSFAARGIEVPEHFRGDSEQLANAIGMSHFELSVLWRISEDELRAKGMLSMSK